MKRHTITDEQVAYAVAIAKVEGNRGAARRLAVEWGWNVSEANVRRWSKGERRAATTPAKSAARDALVAQNEAQELSKWRAILATGGDVVLNGLQNGQIKGRDAAWITAVAQDKVLLMTGKPTERTELVDFVSWLRQPPAERTKSGTNRAPDLGVGVLPVVKQN